MPAHYAFTDLLHRKRDEVLIGRVAASCAASEIDGKVHLATRVDREVMVQVEFIPPGETATRQLRCSMTAVLVFAAGGAQILNIASPDKNALAWSAAAYLNTSWKIPPVPVSLRRIVPGQIWFVECDDIQGLSAMAYSRIAIDAKGRLLGEALTGHLTRTVINGLAARTEREKRVLGDDLATVIAEAATEILTSPDGQSGADSGLPTLKWMVARKDIGSDAWVVVARSADRPKTRTSPTRRNRLATKIDQRMQEDVFGRGIHSPRSKRTIVSLDQAAGPDGAGPTLGDRIIGAGDIGAGLELEDLLAGGSVDPSRARGNRAVVRR